MPYFGSAPSASALTAAQIDAGAVDSSEIATGAVDLAHMSSQSVDEDNLHISNAGSNGQFLSKQSGDAGGLTWAAPAGVAKGWVFIERVTASGTPSTIEFDDIDGTYDRYMFAVEDLIPATDGGQNFNVRISTDNGSTFISSSSYSLLRQRMGTTANLDETGQTTMYSSYQAFGGQASEGCSGTFYLHSPANAARNPLIQGQVFGLTATDGLASTEMVGMYETATAMNAIQFYFTAGNIVDGGHITMYGLTKS
jgi:hypothetical protein